MNKHWHLLHRTKDLEAPLEELRRKLVDALFGVTVQENHLTLRYTDAAGVSVEVGCVITGVRHFVPCCDGCGKPFALKANTYPVKQTTRHDGVKIKDTTLYICEDCAK